MGRRLDSLIQCYVTERRPDGVYVVDVAGRFEQGPMDAADADRMVRAMNSIDSTEQPQPMRRVGSVR